MESLTVGNWKCNPLNSTQAKRIFNSVKKGVKNIKKVKVVICPPFVYIPDLKPQNSNLEMGTQDCFWEEKGAFTGEISPLMLKNLGCRYVIIGHSERRRCFNETDEMINKKIKSVLAAKLKPILCVGENLKEKKKKLDLRILNSQISRGLKEIKGREIKNLIIAYEPIWAIGTGEACNANIVLKKVSLIKNLLKKMYSVDVAKKIKILYGGSVNSRNCVSYIKEAQVNGLLVGGASLKPKEFVQIVKNVSKA